MSEEINDIKRSIIEAGHKAIKELIKVAEEKIITDSEDDLTADKLKNAAASKKLAIFDALEILSRIQEESALVNGVNSETKVSKFKGFAENRIK